MVLLCFINLIFLLSLFLFSFYVISKHLMAVLFVRSCYISWDDTPPSAINAYYDPTRNQLILPAGMFRAPLFDKDLPQ